MSSFFWGYLVAQIPISQLAKRFGGKLLLTIASIFCAVLTILTPWMASIDWKLMLVSRALQGLFQGAYYPCVHTLLSKWVHPMERGTLTTITYSGTQAGSVVMLAVSGLFASSTMGWPSIFYFSGCGTLIWTVFWMIFGSSSPAECTRISIDEKKFIESMPGSSHCQLKTPWSSILRSKPVIALIIVHATQCWGFWSLLTETPSYLVQIFQFNIKTVIPFKFRFSFSIIQYIDLNCHSNIHFFICFFFFCFLCAFVSNPECTTVCSTIFSHVDC